MPLVLPKSVCRRKKSFCIGTQGPMFEVQVLHILSDLSSILHVSADSAIPQICAASRFLGPRQHRQEFEAVSFNDGRQLSSIAVPNERSKRLS